MSTDPQDRNHGFSLLEMMIAMALGTIVLAAAVQLYSQGVSATWTVSQRAEMQQDFRAASNMLTKDISLAGAGMGNNVQIALPSGNGSSSRSMVAIRFRSATSMAAPWRIRRSS